MDLGKFKNEILKDIIKSIITKIVLLLLFSGIFIVLWNRIVFFSLMYISIPLGIFVASIAFAFLIGYEKTRFFKTKQEFFRELDDLLWRVEIKPAKEQPIIKIDEIPYCKKCRVRCNYMNFVAEKISYYCPSCRECPSYPHIELNKYNIKKTREGLKSIIEKELREGENPRHNTPTPWQKERLK